MSRLDPLKPCKRDFKFGVFDIESNNWIDFEMLGFFDGSEFVIFHTLKEFLEFVLVKRFRGWKIFAHNGGRFDFKFLFGELLNLDTDFTFECLESGGRLREIKVTSKSSKCAWYFLDSIALMPASLKKLGEDFDIKHKKLEADYSKISKSSAKDREYLKHDCLGLYELIEKYFSHQAFSDVPKKGTIASNAMSIFRRRMTQSFTGLSSDQEEFIRQGYHGGRVEVFRLWGDDLFHYDVNSLYPYVMRKNEMPIGFPFWVKEFDETRAGFYECRIEYPECHIPALPLLHEGKLIFPVGKFSGVFSSIELRHARDQGAKIDILRGLVFYESAKIFESYVDYFHKMKEASKKDSANYFIAKIYLNSLYGKFGMRRERENLIHCGLEEANEKGFTVWDASLGLYKRETEAKGAYILPQIASWITSLARAELFSILQTARDPVYCDTDSVFSGHKFSESSGLGGLKLEGSGSGVFLRPKIYEFGGRIKAKGYSPAMLSGIKKADFDRALRGDYSGFSRTDKKIIGLRESIKRFGRVLTYTESKKSIKGIYDKRRITNGGKTEPIKLLLT